MSDSTALEQAIATAGEDLGPRDTLFADFSLAVLDRPDTRFLRVRGPDEQAEVTRWLFDVASTRAEGDTTVAVRSAKGMGRTELAIVSPNRPFLVDTLRLLAHRWDLTEECLLHPVFGVERDGSGLLQKMDGDQAESVAYLDASPNVDDTEKLAREVKARLDELAAVTDDHRRMIRAVRELQANLEFAAEQVVGGEDRTVKIGRFLDWLVADSFVFLGVQRYEVGEGGDLAPREKSGLGLLRADILASEPVLDDGGLSAAELQAHLADHLLISIGKSSIESAIHRAGLLDRLLLKEHNEDGRIVGMALILGLFTFRALETPGSQIPLLAERLDAILDATGAPRDSHRSKALVAAFDATPAEFLLSSHPDALARVIEEIVADEGSDEAHLVLAPDRSHRSLYAAVVLPRYRYRDELRDEIARLLVDHLGVTALDFRTEFLEQDTAVLSCFCTAGEGGVDESRFEGLEEAVRDRVAGWGDRLADAIATTHVGGRGTELASRYRNAFPESYRVMTDPSAAVADVEAIETLLETGQPQFSLHQARETTLSLFLPEERLLSDLLPVVDRFGIRVVDATQFEVEPSGSNTIVALAQRIVPLPVETDELPAVTTRLGDALRAVLLRQAPDDDLNGLVLAGGLDWEEVDCLRAYLEYFNQTQRTLTLRYIRQVLLGRPRAARHLLALHRARLDPDLSDGDRATLEAEARDSLDAERAEISSLNEDRALGGLQHLVEATLRTTFFADLSGPHRIAVKIDPSGLQEVDEPRPYREIFVHAAELFGIHLRGGPIARGGLRWSDRADDVRTEVLGLMRTQMIKNGLIVPVGSKGGFITRRPGLAPDEAREFADDQYRVFVTGMLDLTDNRDPSGEIVPPPRVFRRDGDDPYLVVAADKGTAHLSDTANEVAEQRSFWLGDAFASGGSRGYDHKRYAITAGGAWECAKRHFAELGIDPDEDYTIAGIGDMSGDVFGNGLLLTRHGRLLAAFDHRNVFLDPEPDVDAAWQERKRLFELSRSSWADYDEAVISPGGGVFARNAKDIPLAPAVRQQLGLEVESATGVEVVRAILGMEVDLLWYGGIGTYVKASQETHADARDRANDAVRIDASELRARVVAEGGNLGLTQEARIEAALAGVRLNSDAVDNSGGVDLSDHEVNYKILLAPLVHSGTLDDERRDQLLFGVAEDACAQVLGHNRDQALCLSLDERRSQTDPEQFSWAVEYLCDVEGVDPAEGRIPGPAALESRGRGVVRPELAWLLGLAKLHLRRELTTSDRPHHECAQSLYEDYFPASLAAADGVEIATHPLRREITSMAVTNYLVDLGGVTLIPSLVRELDVDVTAAAMLTLVARKILDRFDQRTELTTTPGIDQEAAYGAVLQFEQAVRNVARLVARRDWDAIGAADVLRWQESLGRLRAERAHLPVESDITRGEVAVTQLRDQGFSPELAQNAASVPVVDLGLNIIWVSERTDVAVMDAAIAYTVLGERARLNWVYQRMAVIRTANPWDRLELVHLRSEMLDLHGSLTEDVLRTGGDVVGAVDALLAEKGPLLARIEDVQRRAATSDRSSALASVVKALGRLRA